MAIDTGLNLFFADITAFYHDLIVHHDGRGHWEIECKVLIGLVFGFWL
nr:hypothetical protein [uncultured Desulfobulbus sp.]